ncbi:selenoneine biosynthesis selenosugar synthase SenB [Limnobacter sp.]|uniref:selenoneine biosynthesis selenosugar synthase SenB n=1 Tax=Limnobacter sp. TaxID=2003368 RepID=UPI002FE1D36B
MIKPSIVIVSPALADSNNGNWQTARRWQQFLSNSFDVRIVKQWENTPATERDVAMIALHARRSADSIAAWSQSRGLKGQASPGLILALTGTDLYRDIETDETAQKSLELAQHLIVLQEKGVEKLSEALQTKTTVIFQSTTSRKTLAKAKRRLKVVMVGHLRDEKMPQTLMEAAVLLRGYPDIYIDHIGGPLDPELAQAAQETMQVCPNYRWLGNQPHGATRTRIQRAHVLVHASKMEGGAHVIMEAVCSGTPVVASYIDGNIGMLGAGYPGYFPLGNSHALANVLTQLQEDIVNPKPLPPGKVDLYTKLKNQCAERAKLFAPENEQNELIRLVQRATKNNDTEVEVHHANI